MTATAQSGSRRTHADANLGAWLVRVTTWARSSRISSSTRTAGSSSSSSMASSGRCRAARRFAPRGARSSARIRVRVQTTGSSTYPDVTAIYGRLELDPADPKQHTANPKVPRRGAESLHRGLRSWREAVPRPADLVARHGPRHRDRAAPVARLRAAARGGVSRSTRLVSACGIGAASPISGRSFAR